VTINDFRWWLSEFEFHRARCGRCGVFLKPARERRRYVISWIGDKKVCLPCYDQRDA